MRTARPSEIPELRSVCSIESAAEVQFDYIPKPVSRKIILSTKLKILLTTFIILLTIGLGVILPIMLHKGSTKVESYEETQYNLAVRTDITTTIGNSTTTTHDDFRVTLFGLDMEGDKYRFVVSKGSFENSFGQTSVGSAPSSIFVYLELNSKDGKILLSKYNDTALDEYTVNLLTGITQYFVVDQDSSWDYSMECKEKTEKGQGCSYNSKMKKNGKTLFRKYEKSQDSGVNENQMVFEHAADTEIDESGKVTKIETKGKFVRKVSSEGKSSDIEFRVEAHIEKISESKLGKNQTQELFEIVKDLPESNPQKTFVKKQYKDFFEYKDLENQEEDEPLPEGFKVINTDRKLKEDIGHNNDRSLFDKVVSYKYLNIYSVTFWLDSRLSTGYGDGRYWYCLFHQFNFNSISLNAIKSGVCISSDQVKLQSLAKLKKFAVKGEAKSYLDTITFGIFTIKLTGKVKVDNTPYLEIYLNKNRNTVANLLVQSKVSISITGEASSGKAKCGIEFKNKMTSDINDYMIGDRSPFTAYSTVQKTLEGSFEIWVKNAKVDSDCYDIFGVEFCVDGVAKSDKKTIFYSELDYEEYPSVTLITENF